MTAAKTKLPISFVDTWVFKIPAASRNLNAQDSTLSQEERHRSQSYLTSEKRNQFVAGRVLLRQILGACLDRSPASVPLNIGSDGRPWIQVRQNLKNLGFSLSHSGRSVAIGVVTNGEIGVDIEETRVLRNLDQVARRSMDAKSYERYERATFAERPNVFFEHWTAHEAQLKVQHASRRLKRTRLQYHSHSGYHFCASVCSKYPVVWSHNKIEGVSPLINNIGGLP